MMESVECPLSRENPDSRENEEHSPKSPLRTVSRNSANSGRENTSSPRNDCASPEPNCAICLGKSKNKSFTDSCLHQFCFQCLLEWSKVKAECPLCKQGFKSIIHNVRSIEDYDQYHLRPVESGPWVNLINIDVGLFDVEAQRYQYRSALLNRSLRERALNLQRELINLREPRDAIPAQRTRRRRRGFASEHFRRNVYVQDIWVDYVANVSGARDILPLDFSTRPEEVQRLTPWLNRELLALAMLTSASRIAHVLNLIVSMVSCFHIRSQEFRQAIESHFNPYTDHFIHEFYTFARSGYDMIGFDENAHYVPRNNLALEVVHGVSSDSDDSDVICLSTSNEPLPPESEPSRSHRSNQRRNAISIDIAPSSPVAGPSRAESFIEEVSDCTCNSSHSEVDFSTEFTSQRQSTVATTNLSTGVQNAPGPSLQDVVDSDDSDACLIVGYVKPRHERTPEIITLTSDISEPEVDEAEIIEEYAGPSDESVQHCSCENWMKSCSIHSSPARESSGSEYLPSRERAKRRKCKEKQKATTKSRKKSIRGNGKSPGYSSKKRVNNAEHSHNRSEASCEECYAKRQKLSQRRRCRSSSSSSSCSGHSSSSCEGYSSSSSSDSSSSSSSICDSSICSSKTCRERNSRREKLKAQKSRSDTRERKPHQDSKYKSKSKSSTFDTNCDYKASGTVKSSSSSRHRASKKIRSIIIRRSNTDDTEHPGSSKRTYKGKSTKMSDTKHSRSRDKHDEREPSEIWNIVKKEYPSTSSAVYRYDYPHNARPYWYESSTKGTKNSGRSTEKKEKKYHEKRKDKKRATSDAEGRPYVKKKRKRIVSPESDSSDSD